MIARIRKFVTELRERFWLVPALMVLAGVALALGMVALDRRSIGSHWPALSVFIYDGGATGARTLLGAIASSTIGVAGTVFSITIAALSLAAGQMGPRLLRNFTRDRGNQIALGIFLGVFSYALIVLRSVRTEDEGGFVPHLALSIGILLALVCVATLVFFVSHMARRINVDTVIDLVSDDVRAGLARIECDQPQPARPPEAHWRGGATILDHRAGYLQQLDEDGLADWAAAHGASVRLLLRPGDYVFPGAPIAVIAPPVDGAGAAILDATALGAQRVSAADVESALRQLVEVAVRALSPGINDPHTAISVLDRLGSALCALAPRHLRTGVTERDGRIVLVVPTPDYDGLTDAMLHMIRQNGTGSPAVLIRMLEVLTAVVSCEREEGRVAALSRHAALVLEDAERTVGNASDRDDIRKRYAAFTATRGAGAVLA